MHLPWFQQRLQRHCFSISSRSGDQLRHSSGDQLPSRSEDAACITSVHPSQLAGLDMQSGKRYQIEVEKPD